ncbi:hypothetical protein D3C81_948820 [compost metagenome]
MQLDDRFEGHRIDPAITDNAYAIMVGVTAHLDQCPTEQDAKWKTGAHEGNQGDAGAGVGGIQRQSQRLNICSHARPVLHKCTGVQGLVHVGRRVFLADHLRIVLLIALNQALLLLDIGDAHLHRLQKEMDVFRRVATAADGVQGGEEITH